jgi:hypothetical protein
VPTALQHREHTLHIESTSRYRADGYAVSKRDQRIVVGRHTTLPHLTHVDVIFSLSLFGKDAAMQPSSVRKGCLLTLLLGCRLKKAENGSELGSPRCLEWRLTPGVRCGRACASIEQRGNDVALWPLAEDGVVERPVAIHVRIRHISACSNESLHALEAAMICRHVERRVVGEVARCESLRSSTAEKMGEFRWGGG